MEIYQSQEITKLAKALISVQKELQPAIKDATNPFAKNRYASLNSVMEVCREPLINNGIWLCQYPVPVETPVGIGASLGHVGNVDNKKAGTTEWDEKPVQTNPPYLLGLMTKLTHAESGQWQSSLTVMPVAKADPQGMGSAITYARRYALSAMLGIISEEDLDGEDAKPKPRSTSYKSSTKSGSTKSNNTPPPPQAPQKSQTQKVSTSVNTNALENLKGVVYESVEAQDDDGSIREVITASGNTIPNKEKLMDAGFRWSQSRKIWWKYADAV